VRIAVVNIRRLFNNCEGNANYKAKATGEQAKILAELNRLKKEIEAAQAALKTRKPGTSDYWELREDLMLKQSSFEAKSKFYQQQMGAKDQQWTEQLYKQILECTGEVAKQNEIDIVLAKDEPDLPAAGGTELMLTIRTHKLLYSADDMDITEQVLALLNVRSE